MDLKNEKDIVTRRRGQASEAKSKKNATADGDSKDENDDESTSKKTTRRN